MQISNHLAELSKNSDLYLSKYDQPLFLGDFDAGVDDSSVKNFCSSYNLTSMINRPTCSKNLKHASRKKKYVRGNQSPLMNKTLSKAIMQRSKLRNLFLIKRTAENKNNYVKQRNLCVKLLRKSKREFFGSLNETNLCDNKKIWGVAKHLLSNKVVYNERISLVEDGKIIENDKNTASILNEFFSNIITTLGIPQYNETEPVSHNIGDSLMKAIMKYRFHPSIVAIKKNCNSSLPFSFCQVERDEIMKEINTLRQIELHKPQTYPLKLLRKILIFLVL